MVKIDVTDEYIMEAAPLAVYRAFMNEVSGVTQWWMPDLGFKLKGNIPVEREGAVFDIIAHPNSRLNSKFSCKVKKVVEAKSVDLDIFAGDCIGSGNWIFEEIDGKTKVKIRFNVKTNNRLISLIAPFVDFAKLHSEAVQNGFKSYNSYLAKKSPDQR